MFFLDRHWKQTQSRWRPAVAACLLLLAPRVFAGGDEAVVVYNTLMPGSEMVAEHYAAMRQVPAAQVFGFPMSTNEEISRAEFRDTLQDPLLDKLTSSQLWTFGRISAPATKQHAAMITDGVIHSKIRYAVLCYGVPLKIAQDDSLEEESPAHLPKEFLVNYAAVDSELATLPTIRMRLPLTGPMFNPFYTCTNPAALTPTNGILLVARLDGPTAEIANRLVDKAMDAETNGLWGRAYFDARGLPSKDKYHLGDQWILSAAETAHRMGFETNLDDVPDTLRAGYPLSQVALYAGWYDTDASGPFAAPKVDFMPGAFAYHLHSYSAKTLRSFEHNWVGPLIGKGATCSMGCVYEPYLIETPNVAFFLEAFGNGFTFGEAAWVAQPSLSWQSTVAGDPLYRPFGRDLIKQRRDLALRKSPLIEWAVLRIIDIQLVRVVPEEKAVELLDRLNQAQLSPVLAEKQADLYESLGKPASSIELTQKAISVALSPNQRLRLRLELANRLLAAGRKDEALTDLRQILLEQPDYPARGDIEWRLKNPGAK